MKSVCFLVGFVSLAAQGAFADVRFACDFQGDTGTVVLTAQSADATEYTATLGQESFPRIDRLRDQCECLRDGLQNGRIAFRLEKDLPACGSDREGTFWGYTTSGILVDAACGSVGARLTDRGDIRNAKIVPRCP